MPGANRSRQCKVLRGPISHAGPLPAALRALHAALRRPRGDGVQHGPGTDPERPLQCVSAILWLLWSSVLTNSVSCVAQQADA